MTEQIIGIDFGTSNSVMAWFDPETGKPQIIFNAEGEDKTPSIVYYSPEGVIVGRGAQAALTDAEYLDEAERDEALQSIFCSIKRDLGRRMLHALPDGRQVGPVEIASEIFKKLKNDAEDLFFHTPLKKAVVTHPAAFSPTQKAAVKEAAHLAGFEEITLLDEPVAAALGQLSQGVDIGQGLIVYDLGGGTFDLAYVQRRPEGDFYSPLPSLGLPRCGGDDVDQQLYDLLDEAAHSGGLSLYHLDGNISRFALQECRKCKESLSTLNRSGITIMIPEIHPDSRRYFIKREELENLMKLMVENTVKQTLEMVRRVQQAKLPLDQIVLIGGSTRSPIIPEQLQQTLPQDISLSKTMFADNAVALGAAVFVQKNSLDKKEVVQPVQDTPLQQTSAKSKEAELHKRAVLVVDPKGQGNYGTINEAIDAASPNDSILILAGIYTEQVVITKNLEINGNGKLGEVVLGNGKNDSFSIIFEAETGKINNLVIQAGVKICSGKPQIEGCDISNKFDHCVVIQNAAKPLIRKNHIHNGKGNGVFVDKESSATIETNDIYQNNLSGIFVDDRSSVNISNNRIHDGKGNGIRFGYKGEGNIENNDIFKNSSAGIEVRSRSIPNIKKNKLHDGYATGLLFDESANGLAEDNDIYENAKSNVMITNGSNPTLRKNRIHDGKAEGLLVTNDGKGEILENEIYSNKSHGIRIYSGDPNVQKCIIRNNKSGVHIILSGKGTFIQNEFTGNKQGNWLISSYLLLVIKRKGNIEK